MGNLVDTFILIPKDIDICTYISLHTKYEYKKSMLDLVRDKYVEMLSDLIDMFLEKTGEFSIYNIIQPKNDYDWNLILDIVEGSKKYKCNYDDRFRGDCLRQELRRVFYDTICIIENDYNDYKTNKFLIVGSDNVITEYEWEKSRRN